MQPSKSVAKSNVTSDAPSADVAPLVLGNVADISRIELKARENALREAGIEVDDALHRANRRLNAISIAIPFAGAVHAIALSFALPPTPMTLLVFSVFFFVNGFGITLGLHRYFTHRAFETGTVFAALLAVVGTWSFQGPILRWVADHRRHHRFTDREHDPHSPYCNHEGVILSRFLGFAHAHFFWMLTGLRSNEQRYASDILKHDAAGWCSRHYWAVAATGLILPGFAGYLLDGAREAFLCILWAGFFRVALLHQITWSVNSFGHMFGTKRSDAKDQSRDNPILAIMLLGEGLHSFHHRFPSTAINRPAVFDMSGLLVRLLERMGIIWKVNRPVRD